MEINKNFKQVEDSYLFSTINKKVTAYQTAHPDCNVIRLGIGDVTLPLCDAVVTAMRSAVTEMSKKETFRGYGPEQGYAFLREAIQKYYLRRQVELDADEIFVSDGAKSDIGNILDLFSTNNTVLVPDPVYPVYVDTNKMSGRKIIYANANAENRFLPLPDKNVDVDIIYLCSPNNPTGAVYNKEQLQLWVDYALEHQAIILFDAAYEAFIQEDFPHSIYEIEGSKHCAIEFCSFSKTAGFTGTRCGYTVVPSALIRDGFSLHNMWFRRQSTKFNGVPYIVQRGAEAVFSDEGQKETRDNIKYYLENANIIAERLRRLNINYTGGTNSPYIWMECPQGMSSWEFFDCLLEKANVVGTPGSGFGSNGEGYFRLTAFNSMEKTSEAALRIEHLLKK
ncbi:MAG: LL-diaminopimelate aminotransferase [Clostridiales bacterium]|nr:LL-diaminopimelate aminotransferase [Clostridiales bacterium]